MNSNVDFEDSASACAIDALSIICKRSTVGSDAFFNLDNEEVENVHFMIKSGEASRNDLEDASNSNILWCSIVLLLRSKSYFAGSRDIAELTSDLPVHIQRFFGALFSTFEVIMDHQRSNHSYLVGSLIASLGRDVINMQATVTQLIKEYKSLFSYTYMFNRRTGVHPVSQVLQISAHFTRAAAPPNPPPVAPAVESDRVVNLDEDDDNDSYERLMRANTGSYRTSKFGAPTVMPLRPVKLLSDDEHYGSEYQPAIASDLETDLTYNSNSQRHNDSHGALQDDSIFSMDGGSILNSYYKYSGWNNAVEEDEDSDNDHYAPPVAQPARPKRMTRMRQANSRSFDNSDGLENKGKKTRKKTIKKTSAKDSASNKVSGPAAGMAYQAGSKAPWASMTGKGILSDDSEIDSNDDAESDYSASDHTPAPRASTSATAQPHRITAHQAAPHRAPVQYSDEVADFEMEDDAYVPTARNSSATNTSWTTSGPAANIPSSSSGHATRREGETYSPNSGNSSIDLSDRERRKDSPPSRHGSASNGGWRQQQRVESSRGHSGGRIRSVLSDDESDTEDVVLPASKQHHAKAAPYRNPLDASIETPGGFGVGIDKTAPAVQSRNPLDQSIEFPTAGGNTRESSDWAKRDRGGGLVVDDHNSPLVPIPTSSNRSVVRLPSASPSKPSASKSWASDQRQGKGGATEGSDVDLVEDWDSQLSDDEPVGLSVKADTQHNLAVREQSIALPLAAPPKSALTAPVIEHARVQPVVRVEPHSPKNASSSSSGVSPERTTEMERLRQNILRNKREKEIAEAERLDKERHDDLVLHSRSQRATDSAKRDPSPSALRKSVTFEDQQVRPSGIVAPAVEPRQKQVATPEDFQLVAPLQHRSVTGSPDGVVLHPGGDRNSLGGLRKEKDSLENLPQHVSSPFEGSAYSQTLGVAVTEAAQIPRQEQNSPKLPPARPPLSSAPLLEQPSPAVLSQTQPVPILAAPTLSRVPSHQFMAPRQTSSVRESTRDAMTDSRQSSSNVLVSTSISQPLLTLPGNFVPPPLSEFALKSGIIMEGYLHKKSGMLGLWQKRYFVLSESTTSFCVLRIFTRAVQAGWGPVAVGLKASIPIHSIEAVESTPTPAAKGKEFTIKFCPRVSKQSLSAVAERDVDAGSDAGSEFSDSMFASGGTKLTTLLAEDAQTRLMWVTMLTRVLAIALEDI